MNIYRKIWMIQGEVDNLIKSERNGIYSFFNEAQVLDILKPLLYKYKICITFSDDKSRGIEVLVERERSKEGKEGENYHIVTYQKIARIVDVESGEEMIETFWATGNNSDISKAKGSADTYSIKYFLSKFFLMKVKDSLDPDRKS